MAKTSRKLKFILLCLILVSSFSQPKFNVAVCGNEIMTKVLNPRVGRGKGSKGFKRRKFATTRGFLLIYLLN